MLGFHGASGAAAVWLAAAGLCLAALAPGAATAQITINEILVNTDADRDLTCGEAGLCSPREAIKLSNTTMAEDGVDEIVTVYANDDEFSYEMFDDAGAGFQRID